MSARDPAPESGSEALPPERLNQTLDELDHTPTSPLSELDEEVTHLLLNGASTIKIEEDSTTSTTLRPDPLPSVKRRESEGGVPEPDPVDKPNNKKRKRGSSPPWQFPSADTTTLKTADGRRISARVNTNTPTLSENDGRARSSSLSAAPERSRPPSPPWKRFRAEGPTSLVVDGKRKSGRVNKELSDPPKRVSPRSKKQEDRTGTHKPVPPAKAVNGTTHVKMATPTAHTPAKAMKDASRSPSSSDSMFKIAELRAQIEALKPTRSFPPPEQPKRSHKRKPSNETPARMDGPSSPPATQRKLPRASRASLSPQFQRPSPKIKLRFTAARHVVPPPHPNAKVPSPTRPPSLSLSQVIEQYELKEMQQPYSENERGPPDMAWFLQRAERQAVEEGAMRRKMLEEAHDGGKLSREKLSIYQDVEPQPEPPKQYGHHDHVVAHALHLRHLQLREKTHHRNMAKKVAHDALEFWRAKRGPDGGGCEGRAGQDLPADLQASRL